MTDDKPKRLLDQYPIYDAQRPPEGPRRPLEDPRRPLEDGERIDDITLGKNQVPATKAGSSLYCADCGCSTGGLPCAVCMFRGDDAPPRTGPDPDPETRVLAQCRRCCLPYEIVAHGRTATQAHHDEPHCVICAVIVKKIISDLDSPPRSPLFWGTMLVFVGLLVTLGVVVLCKFLE